MALTSFYMALAQAQVTVWLWLAQWGVWGLVGVLVLGILYMRRRTP